MARVSLDGPHLKIRPFTCVETELLILSVGDCGAVICQLQAAQSPHSVGPGYFVEGKRRPVVEGDLPSLLQLRATQGAVPGLPRPGCKWWGLPGGTLVLCGVWHVQS